MRLRQWLAALLALALVFGFAGCRVPASPAPPTEVPTEAPTEPATEPVTEAPTETPTEPLPENVGPAVMRTLHTAVTEQNAADYDFSALALEYLTILGENFTNRSFGGLGENNTHEQVADWILGELRAAGYRNSQLTQQTFAGTTMYGDTATGRNLILTVEGTHPDRQIIVGAHYDGDGLGDNASGVALLLANAVGLYGVQPYYTVKYIFFDGENDGMYGSNYYCAQMSAEEAAGTIYMINLEVLVFGDFCNIYGGTYGAYDPNSLAISETGLPEPVATEAYAFAADVAEELGIRVYRTEALDGYFDEHGIGMDVEENALFTNPWTNAHPAPDNMLAPSPATLPAGDHVGFTKRGIEYIFFQATNWFAAGTEPFFAYTGRIETYAYESGLGGMFMKTEYDTLEELYNNFPNRAAQHYTLYSRLLSGLLLVEPEE